MASRILRLPSKFQPIAQRFLSSHAADYKAAIANLPIAESTILDNGVRVVSEDDGRQFASVGLWLDAGSRHEDTNNNGIGNLFNKIALSPEIVEAAESKGITLAARFGREQSAFTAKCQPQHVATAVELLCQAVTKPKLNDADVEKARQGVLRDIDDVYNNRYDELVIENLHSFAYVGTPLGQPLAGSESNVKDFRKEDLKTYIENNYQGSRVVLAAGGAVDHAELTKLAQKHLGGLQNTFDGKPPVLAKCRYTSGDVRDRDDSLPHAYGALAIEGPGWNHPDYLALELARQYLGSWNYSLIAGQGHPLALGRKCASGNIAHHYQHFNYTYSDSALWGVYFVIQPMEGQNFLRSCTNEWMAVCNTITESQVNRAKAILKNNLLRGLREGCVPIANQLGQETLAFGRRVPFSEWEQRIDSLTATQVRDAASEFIYNRAPVAALVGQHENILDYTWLSLGLSWYRL